MPDYKELFYISQKAINDTIDTIEEIKAFLIKCMQECEDEIVSDDNPDTE
jgi:hypothetical protein